ncbi:MAG: hypothetical protein ABSE06_09415 [Anaerolineaceae bacterium]|jgi:hypothetical protein
MRPSKHTNSHSIVKQFSTHPYLAFFIILALLMLAGIACNFTAAVHPAATQGMSLDQALAVTPRDDRSAILKQMGRPDVFRITFETLDAKPVRYEEWSYLDDKTRLDFVNGTLVDSVTLDKTPNGTIFASYYDPQSFTAFMTEADVKTLLAGQQLLEVDTAQVGQPDGLVVAGRQILLGFDHGQLVSVETLAFIPQVTQ